MTRPIWIACGEKPAIYEYHQSPIVVQKHQQGPRTSPTALCTNLWLLKTPFFARRPKHHPHPAADPPKVGHRRARHRFTFRQTPQDARSPRRTPRYARSAPFFSSALIPEDRGRRDPMGLPLNAFRSTKPFSNARSAPLFPQPVIRRRPDIAGSAISLLLGTLRRTQEALAARSAQRGLLACPRTCLKVN